MIGKIGLNLLNKTGSNFVSGKGSRLLGQTVRKLEKSNLADYVRIGTKYEKSFIESLFNPKSDGIVLTNKEGFKQLWTLGASGKNRLVYSFKKNNDGTAIFKTHVNSTKPNATHRLVNTCNLRSEGDDYIVTGFKQWHLENFQGSPQVRRVTKNDEGIVGTITSYSTKSTS